MRLIEWEDLPDRTFNIIIKRKTLSIFNAAKRCRNKKRQYGIDWNFLIKTLEPFPRKRYHVDHIKPLSEFNFEHPDGSLNLTELKKAWSPANLRIIEPNENTQKRDSCDILNYPFRFEFVFTDLDKLKEIYDALDIERAKDKQQKEKLKNIIIDW